MSLISQTYDDGAVKRMNDRRRRSERAVKQWVASVKVWQRNITSLPAKAHRENYTNRRANTSFIMYCAASTRSLHD